MTQETLLSCARWRRLLDEWFDAQGADGQAAADNIWDLLNRDIAATQGSCEINDLPFLNQQLNDLVCQVSTWSHNGLLNYQRPWRFHHAILD